MHKFMTPKAKKVKLNKKKAVEMYRTLKVRPKI